jgi:ABC-type transporter Mla subunit MlaD
VARPTRQPARSGGAGGWVLDHPLVVLALAGVLAFTVWAVRSRHQPHEVRAVFSDAVSLYPGLDVRIDGLDAGKVKKVDYSDGNAVARLGIYDSSWPLHRGTTATLRFGTTIGNGTRIVDLDPGPASAPELPERGIIPNKDTLEATEFDDVFDTLDAKTRKRMQGAMHGMGRVFGPRAPRLNAGVKASAPGLQAVGGFAGDIARDEMALKSLVANGHRVTSTLAARHAQIADLMSVTSATFRTFAANTAGIRASLDRFPATLRDTRSTLARLDGSVDRVDALMADLRPGAAQLRPLARELRPALNDLRETVPAGVAALRAGRRAGPDLVKLLAQATPFAHAAAPAFEQLAPIFACLRPYAPELAGLLGTWSSWPSYHDQTAHYGRVQANFGLSEPVIWPKAVKSAKFTKLTGQKYALVRPPGYNSGQPMFMPECGAGPDGLDPNKDPEAGK